MDIYAHINFTRLPLPPAAGTQRPKLVKISYNKELTGPQRDTDSNGVKSAKRIRSKKFRAIQREMRALDKKIRYFYLTFLCLFMQLILIFFYSLSLTLSFYLSLTHYLCLKNFLLSLPLSPGFK